MLLLENIIFQSNNRVRYDDFKHYLIQLQEDREGNEDTQTGIVHNSYSPPSEYLQYIIPSEDTTLPSYMSLTEKIRASFKPSYSNYSKDVMSKEIAFVNMPDISAYGWTFPGDPEAPIYINTAYANTDEQITSTIAHEMYHEQSITYHEPPMLHEQRVRLMTDTSYLG
jgi:hypothetical protein